MGKSRIGTRTLSDNNISHLNIFLIRSRRAYPYYIFHIKEIKKFMSTSGLDKVTSEHFVASYSVSKSESFDEEKLINRLKALGCSHVIKTVEVVDMELLESAIYDGQIAGSELADCKVVKEIPKLVVKVKKAGKKDESN
jgi:hypothetical protein